MNFSNMSPSPRLQFFINCSSVGPFPRGVVLQEQTALLGHKLCQQTCSSTGSSPHGTQVPGPCSSTGFPWGHSLDIQLDLGPGGFLLHHDLPWAAGAQPDSPQSWGICALSPGASPPTPALTSVGTRFFLTYSHLSFPAAIEKQFLPLFHYFISVVLPLQLLDLALACGTVTVAVLQRAGTPSVGHEQSSQQPLTETTSVHSGYQNLAMPTKQNVIKIIHLTLYIGQLLTSIPNSNSFYLIILFWI